MDSAHVIESLGFELEYASEERAFERQERLAGFARGRGLQVIAEVFDEMSPPGGEVLRLDRLELDLGPVDEEDLEHDLARRLREALRLALSDGLHRAREEAGRFGLPQARHALPSTDAPPHPHSPLQPPHAPLQSPHTPFGLSPSKPSSPAHQPFDKLRANGEGEAGAQTPQTPPSSHVTLRPHGPLQSPHTPFGLSPSKPSSPAHQPFDKLRANGGGEASAQTPQTPTSPQTPPSPHATLHPHAPFQSPHTPFGLSLSKPSSPARQPFDKLRANGEAAAPGPRPPQASVHPRTHAWRAALLHFLQHGHLPWHADRHLAANPGAALQALLHDDGPAFAAALHALPPTSPAWHRLAGLASPPLRLRLARLLAPTAGDWLQALAAALDNPAPAAGAQGWRDQAWAALLPALMAPGSAATLPTRLREPLRPVMASVADPAQQPALAAVRAALGEPAPHPLAPAPHTQPDGRDHEDSTLPPQRSFWRARVEAALQAGSLAGTADAWRALLRHDRGWLRTRIAALGRSARTRRTLAQGLDPALLHELIGVWVNTAMQRLVAAVIHRLLRLAGEAAAQGQAAMARITAPVLWEHTLAHLWVDGETDGSVPAHEASRTPPSAASAGEGRGEGLADAMPYVESLLRRLGHAEDISPGAWVPASGPTVPKADFRTAAVQVLRLLHTSAPEAPGPHDGAAPPARPQTSGETPSPAAAAQVPPQPTNLPQPPGRDASPADARVRLWRQLLLAALTAPEGAVHALDPRSLEGLLRQDPGWLRATLQRLGRAVHVRRRIAQDLGPALLRDLLGLWVSPARQDAIAAFVHGLASLARRQPALARLSAAGLWAHVLGHLWLEQDPAQPQAVGDGQALARSVLRQLAEHGEIAPSGWPALLGPGGNLDAALPWVLAQIGHLPPGTPDPEDGAGSSGVTTLRGVVPPHTPSPAPASAAEGGERAGAGARAPWQAKAASGGLPSPQPSPAEAGEGVHGAASPAEPGVGVHGAAASAKAGERMRKSATSAGTGEREHGPATPTEAGERRRRPAPASAAEEPVRGTAASAAAAERQAGPASPAEAGRQLPEAVPAAAAEAGAGPAAPDAAASPPRIHVWRRLLLAALAPAAAAAPLPPALDARCWAGLLRHDAAWLRATLQRLGRSAAVRRRIAHGLDAGLLRDLAGLWVVPARQDFMAATVHGLDRLARRQPALSGVAAAGLWEHTLAWLWLERRAAPEDAVHDERAFVQSLLRHLERQGDVAPTAWQALLGPAADLEAAVRWVLAQVGAWAPHGPAAAQPEGPAAHEAHALPVAGTPVPGAGPADRVQRQAEASPKPPGDKSPAAPVGARQAEAPATTRALRAWRRMLRTMLAPHGPGAAQAPWDPACWEGLLRHDAPWLRAKVQRLGRFAHVRRAIAHGLSPALLRELAGLWVGPDRQDFIAAFVQGLERLVASNPALPRVAGPDLWAQALGPLWVDPQGARPGAEGERAFVMGMLRQLGQHDGVDPAAWARGAGAGDADAAAAWVQRQIRAALADERPGAVGGGAGEPGPQPRRVQLAAAVSAGRFEADFEALWFDASRDDALWLRALLCREDLAGGEPGDAWALGQAPGEPSPTPVRPELVEGLVPHAPGLRQAQGEREMESDSERTAADVGEREAEDDARRPLLPPPLPLPLLNSTRATHPTPGLAPHPAPIAALRRALAQRLPQPRWQQSLSPWLTPSECNELAATVRRLAQAAVHREPQAGDLEPWVWDRTLAHLWRLPPQRLDLHALAQHLAQDLAQRRVERSAPSPASAGEGRNAPHPNPLPLIREREFVGSPPPPMPERESAGSPTPPMRATESAGAHLPPMPQREPPSSPAPQTPEQKSARPPLAPSPGQEPAGSPLPPMAHSESAPPQPPASPENDPAEQALLRLLQARTPLPPADAALWRAQWAAASAHPSPHWRRRLRLALETPPAATRLVELLPRAELVATLRLLRPTEHADWQATATLITQACRATGTAGAPGQLEALAWQAIFREAIEEGRPLHTATHISGFARRLVAELARQLMPPDPPHWQRTLVQALARGSDTLAAALRADLQQPAPPAPVDAAPWDRPVLDWDDLADGDAIHVGNAGLVLAGPYLPRLLRMLGLAGDVAFTPPEAAAERGVHLLQAVVDGRGDTAEPLLVLNKLLCGLPLATPVPPAIELTPQELAAIDGMLKAMIQHWRTLGNTSVAGLRETFLQREGRLMRKNDAWHLVVERRPLDVLLDRLPWGFATIKYPWMEQVLHVQWS